ncbi:hypothetical protein Tco_0246255 [Tanacetum coccineum]
MMEDFTERMNQELHKQEVLLAAQREQELLAQKQAAQEKQVPSPNSVFRQLIEEMCGTKVCEDQKQNMEDTMLDLLEICRQKELYCMHNNVEDLIESDLNSKLLSINLNSQHLDKEKQEGDIIYLESLLIDDTSPNLPPEVFFDHDPRSLKDEPDNDDLMTEDKVFDPGIHEKSFSPTFVKLTFEDRHYFPITFVIRIFLPYLTYSVDSSFLLSSGSEDTIFDPGISAFHFSSLKPVAYENPMGFFSILLATKTSASREATRIFSSFYFLD